MRICTFFGHRDASQDIVPKLYETVERLITDNSVDVFYIGNQGLFDSYAKSVILNLRKKHSHIKYYIVLAYRPTNGKRDEYIDFSDTILPDGIEKAHPRYAIAMRNKWMVEKADFVVSYVTHCFGGAYSFTEMARKKKKKVINIEL